MFELLGFNNVTSIDLFCDDATEKPTMLHDLSNPIPKKMHKKFSVVYDGTTLYHVFNRAQALANAANLLETGGIVIHTGCIDPLCTVFSPLTPELLVRFYECNGFDVVKVSLCRDRLMNSIFTLDGDYHSPFALSSVFGSILFFAAIKREDKPLNLNVIEWQSHSPALARANVSLDVDSLKGKKIAIWGTSGHYRDVVRDALSSLMDSGQVILMVDGDATRQHQQIDGISIQSPDCLVDADIDVVVIASSFKRDIFNELCMMLTGKPHVLLNTYKLYENIFNEEMYRRRTIEEYQRFMD